MFAVTGCDDKDSTDTTDTTEADTTEAETTEMAETTEIADTEEPVTIPQGYKAYDNGSLSFAYPDS